MPSGDVAAEVDGPDATTTKTPLPKVTETQLAEDGSVRAVQVIPSTEVAATVPVVATATNTPFPYAIEVHWALGSVLAVAVNAVTGVVTSAAKAV